MSRKPAMLTPDQRAYLRGEKAYNTDVESNVRYEIRNRVRDSLADFALLLQELEARDREQLFKDLRPIGLRDSDEVADDGYRQDALGDLVHGIGFLYLVIDDTDIPFEEVLAQGITAARSVDGPNPFVARSVAVEIDEQQELDLDHLLEEVAAGRRLTDFEYFGVLRRMLADPDEFDRAAAAVDIEADLAEGEPLTRGESLIAVGQVSQQSLGRLEYDLRDLLHDDVITHLGLSNAFLPNNS